MAEAVKRFDHLKRVEAEQDSDAIIDALFTAGRRVTGQLDLVNQYNGTIDPTKVNKNFIFVKFCDDYVKQIESLVYPEWYTACFTADCGNSSIWGSYGRGHTGVCLIFKVAEKSGLPMIRLNRMMGWGSAGPIYGDMGHPFCEIKYGAKPVEVDFFKSLGRMPIPMLNKYWYRDESGQRSPAGEHLAKSEDEWRAKYWDNFNYSVTTKLEDFRHEKEYRVVLPVSVLDYSDESRRKSKYYFDDLEGIIFGMRTPEKEKMDIARIVEAKCRSSGRFDFKFYQAFYSRQKGTIEHAELGLLKFQE